MEEKKKFLIHSTYYMVITFMVFIFFRYVFIFIAPFCISLFLAMVSEKCSKTRGFRTPIFYLTLIYISFTVISLLFLYILSRNITNLVFLSSEFSFENIEILDTIMAFFSSVYEDIARSIFLLVSDIFAFLPTIAINAVLIVLSSYYFTLNYSKMRKLILSRIKSKSTLIRYKRSILTAIFCIVRSHFITGGLLFFITAVGYYAIALDDFLGLAIITAALDIIPILGVGFIIIPLCLYHLAMGSLSKAIILVVIYIICVVIKHIIEPKILSKSMGLGVFETIICMIIGGQIYGFLGVLIAPVIFMIIKSTFDTNERV